MIEDEMIERHHLLNGYEFEQTQGDSEGQGSLACYSPWGHKESDMTKRLNNSKLAWIDSHSIQISSPTLTSIHDYWKNNIFGYTDICQLAKC